MVTPMSEGGLPPSILISPSPDTGEPAQGTGLPAQASFEWTEEEIPHQQRTPVVVAGLYRAATNGLRRLPFASTALSDDWFPKKNLDIIMEAAREVMKKHNITEPAAVDTVDDSNSDQSDCKEQWEEDGYISIVNRHPPGAPETGTETLLIISDWDRGCLETWPRAIQDLLDVLDELPCSVPYLDIELIAPDIIREFYISPVMDDPEMTHWYRGAQPEISSLLRHHLPGDRGLVTSMLYLRIGPYWDRKRNPIKIWVGVEKESDETQWPSAVDALQELLARAPRPVTVRIEHV